MPSGVTGLGARNIETRPVPNARNLGFVRARKVSCSNGKTVVYAQGITDLE